MTMQPASRPVVSADDMRARLAQLSVEGGPTTPVVDARPAAHQQLRDRVVLLDYFTADDVIGDRDGVDKRDKAIEEFVAADCEFVTTRSGGGWRLKLEVRRDTLGALGVDGALATSTSRDAVKPGPDDVVHRMAVRLLRGETDLRGLSPNELTGVLRALEWLDGLPLALPSLPTVQTALDLANVLAPLRAVETPDFVGRERELARLEDYVRSRMADRPPLALHGPGGVGKSTLLATFVLRHVEGSGEPMPFAYLSFDRAELDPEFPVGLIAEICRQLALQSPDLAGPLGGLRREIAAVLEAEAALQREKSSSRGTRSRDTARRHLDEDLYIRQLSTRLRGAWGDKPVLVVFDTFEVAQRRRRSSMTRLDRTLTSLREQLASLRVILAGRAVVEDITADNTPLEGLDRAQSVHLLRKAVGDLAVTDTLIEEVADQVSGNPLSLRLAAELMRREGAQVLATKRGRRRLLFSLRAEQVQGVLYKRILDHVAPAIRPLANPGLVVRQITREIILEVLAEPCGLGQITPGEADRLFRLLEEEVSLVTTRQPGLLVHRSDVRREMLPLLDTEDHDRVKEVNRRAAEYYATRPSTDDRIEELYHRLMMGESTAQLDAHWDRSAGPFLELTMPELPAASRVYLASKLHLEVDPADLEAADYTAWARQATEQARSLLDSGHPAAAWDMLDANHRQPRLIAVSRLRMEALATLGRYDEARAEAEAAIAAAEEQPLSLDFIELCIVGARVAEDSGDFERAMKLFTDARDSAQDFGARTAALTAGAGMLRMVRRGGARGETSTIRRVRGELIAEVASISEEEKSRNPGLVRELAAELGDAVPSLLVDAAEHVGVTSGGDDAAGHDAETLGVLQENIRQTLVDAPDITPEGVRQRALRDTTDDADEPWDLRELSSSTQGHLVAEAVKSEPTNDRLRESLKKYWEGEADRPSYDYNADS
jgi:tetratricopeptide (TPR) repeat protein